jgi:hypothetical protein
VLAGQVRGVAVTAADYGILKANHLEHYQVALAELRRSVPALALRQPRPGSYRAEDGYELRTDDPSFTDGALDAPTIDRLRALGDEVLVDARDRTLAVRIRGAGPDAVIGLIEVTAHVADKLVAF